MMILNGHRTLHCTPARGVSSSNLFLFMRFRTLCPQRGTPNPFVINHFRTLSRATEGRGLLSAPIPNAEPLVAVFCFQSLTHCPICNSFVLITLQQYPGVCTPPLACDLKFYFKSPCCCPVFRKAVGAGSSFLHQSPVTIHQLLPPTWDSLRPTANGERPTLFVSTGHQSQITSHAALIPDSFAVPAFVVAAFEPAVAQQNRLDARNHNGLGFFDVAAGREFLPSCDCGRDLLSLSESAGGNRQATVA